ncbi:MAG: ATP-binding protein [Holophagaceae bacterium]|nr:ATP-binding protein [Holophagaceae bacterium]
MEKSNKAMFRVRIKFLLFIVVFVLAMFSFIYNTSPRQIAHATLITVEIAGMPILERASIFIDGDKFEQLTKTLDESDPFYVETQNKFRELKEETECSYLYAMAPKTEDVYFFIFDGEDPNSEDFSALGTEENVTEYDPAFFRTFGMKEPQYSKVMFDTKWGFLISAYKPILNSKGDIVGVIGVDFDGSRIMDTINAVNKDLFIYGAIFVVVGLVISFFLLNDITRQNKELLKMSRLAEDASRAKSDFLARMSHEIRTPLNAVIGLSELAHREFGTSKGLEYIVGIRNSGATLMTTINEILDFSKIESGHVPIHEAPFASASLVHDALTIIRVRIAEKPLDLILDIDPYIPKHMIGDVSRIRQVLINLLGNAVKYSEKGFVKFSFFGKKISDNSILLTMAVEDSGIGIRPEDLPEVFNAFTRADEFRNRAIEGTGLGLQISRTLCRAMGGDIVVESEYGKGSVFTATMVQSVDVWEPMGDAVSNPPMQSEKPYASFIAPDAKILVVDDFASNLVVAEGMLEPYELCVITVQSGKSALKLVQTGHFDLIFMDHMMPEMDGIEATIAIRALGGSFAELPIIALTANVLSGMGDMFLENGFNDFLAKPIETPKLDFILQKWVPREKQIFRD